jgi:hypothetical protein
MSGATSHIDAAFLTAISLQNVVGDVHGKSSLLPTVSAALQVPHLKFLQHALQSLRLLTAVSLNLWMVTWDSHSLRDHSSGQPPSKLPKHNIPTNPPGGLSVPRNITSACVQLQHTVQLRGSLN